MPFAPVNGQQIHLVSLTQVAMGMFSGTLETGSKKALGRRVGRDYRSGPTDDCVDVACRSS